MPTVCALDVAEYILSACTTPMTTTKLHKLVYYSQAWHLAWTGTPLFDDDIEAWASGPVVLPLFQRFKGRYSIDPGQPAVGESANLSPQQRDAIDSVLATYGSMSATQLSLLTHAEAPWSTARAQSPADDGCSATITIESMRAFYSELGDSASAVRNAAEVNFPAWA